MVSVTFQWLYCEVRVAQNYHQYTKIRVFNIALPGISGVSICVELLVCMLRLAVSQYIIQPLLNNIPLSSKEQEFGQNRRLTARWGDAKGRLLALHRG